MTQPIRVLLADDHPLVRMGIRMALEEEADMAVVGEATHSDEVIHLCAGLDPDVILLDLSMPGPSPATTVTALQDAYPALKIVILSAYSDPGYIHELIVERQVPGYVLKDDAPAEVACAIRAVIQGKIWYSQAVVQRLIALQATGKTVESLNLNLREREIFGLLIQGRSNTEIARELGLANQTVKNYVSHIYAHLNVSSRAEVILWALEHGFQPGQGIPSRESSQFCPK